jgi:CelD/BcsL family acetyltransferase involved in cellulose biosynthesis
MAHLLIKIGYDHDSRTLSPGMILRLMMLERAYAGSTETYEFLGAIVPSNNRG